MSIPRPAQIALRLAVPALAVFVAAPAIRARGGRAALLWVSAGLVTFGIVMVVLSGLLAARRRRV